MAAAQCHARICLVSGSGERHCSATSARTARPATGSARRRPDLLLGDLAYRLQEKRYGGLAATTLRGLQRAGTERPAAPTTASMGEGTQVVRTWRGRTIVVTKQGRDYVHEGRHYRSLTQIAHVITGTRWSGPRFFGLVKWSTKVRAATTGDGDPR